VSSLNVPEKPLVASTPPNSGRAKPSANGVCWLVTSSPFQVPCFEGPLFELPFRVDAARPEIRPAAEQNAVTQDQHAAVAPLQAVEHVEVDGIKPVLHVASAAGATIAPATESVETVKRSLW
jgi:hypothetical protein